ncbi:MAG: metal ABC transporter permease [Candidatus Atribacteria bacterium]|nr:metal ABC transporter permease [Candidatus Atribacteria bacterium]
MSIFEILPLKTIIITLLGTCLAGAVCSLIGTFIVRMKLTSLGFCMSHAAFAGSALGLALSLPPLWLALAFSILVAFILGPLADKSRLQPEIILGILFSLTMALGLTFLNFIPDSAMSSTAMSILWGSILGITDLDVIRLAVLTFSVILIIILFFKEFHAIMFDRKMAEASGIATKPFYYLILFLTGITVAFSIKLVGGLLIFALIVNPASCAYQYFYDFRKILLFSPLFGILFSLGGIILSFLLDFPIGSSIAITSSVGFGLSVILSPKRRKG